MQKYLFFVILMLPIFLVPLEGQKAESHANKLPTYLQGKEFNELVQVLFILGAQAAVHVFTTLQTKARCTQFASLGFLELL